MTNIITNKQITIFEEIAFNKFVKDLIVHCYSFAPYLREMNPENLENILREQIKQIEGLGFTLKGSTMFFIEMMITLGYKFYEDPQYPWVLKILKAFEAEAELTRASELYDESFEYLNEVNSNDSEYKREAYIAFNRLNYTKINFTQDFFVNEVLAIMKEIHPQKMDKLGELPIRNLINEGVGVAKNIYGFKELNQIAFIIFLMFFLGNKFYEDPLLPMFSKMKIYREIGKMEEELCKNLTNWTKLVLVGDA